MIILFGDKKLYQQIKLDVQKLSTNSLLCDKYIHLTMCNNLNMNDREFNKAAKIILKDCRKHERKHDVNICTYYCEVCHMSVTANPALHYKTCKPLNYLLTPRHNTVGAIINSATKGMYNAVKCETVGASAKMAIASGKHSNLEDETF